MAYIFANGSGTAEDPYQVATADDLNGVRDYLSAHFKQTADIDLSGYANWEPIGTYVDEQELEFRGIYDGNGHTIRHLKINLIDREWVGLFGATNNAAIKNLDLIDVDVSGGMNEDGDRVDGSFAGALAGLVFRNTDIINCRSTGNVIGSEVAGGLAGYVVGSNISDCRSSASVTGGLIAGGLIGMAYGYDDPDIGNDYFYMSSCHCTGSVTSYLNRRENFIGGLVGSIQMDYTRVFDCYSASTLLNGCFGGGLFGAAVLGRETEEYNVLNCYSICDISGGAASGGLIGVLGKAVGITFTICNCYSASSLSGMVAVGGLIAYLAIEGGEPELENIIIISSYYDSNKVPEYEGGLHIDKGEPKTTAEMKQQETFVGWDFETVWAIDPAVNDGYPYLQGLQPPPPVEVLPSYTPQSTIKLEFSAGDSDPYPMGIFYADKSVYKVGSAGTKINGRNSIGKYLKDQSFDERCKYPSQAVSTMLEAMLAGAGLTKYYVQPSTVQIGMDFAPNKNILDGIEEILQYLPSWQMREEVDGTVVIGERTDSHFAQPSRYTFQRDRDIFSREVVTDDRSIYGRVCVHTEDFTVRVYRPVTSDLGWTPPAQKTLYQQVPEGTTSMEAATIANSLAASMANSGKVETFVCAFRPQIIPGDEAGILEADASKNVLGVITQVKHSFGVQGFYTEIVVDSGGRVAKPRFKDIVSAFTPPPASKKN